MPRLSEKYVAGFLDADGCVSCSFPKKSARPQMTVSFSQKSSKDEVLKQIQDSFGGGLRKVNVKGVVYSNLVLCGSTAKNCLNRISKYLVIKRHYANFCMDTANRDIECSKDEAKKRYKAERRLRSLPLPKHPTRKWTAGYFDGDGCLSVMNIRRPFGQAHIVSHIACSDFDTEGIEILQNAFGGKIHDMKNGRCKQWVLSLSTPSKAIEFLSFFGKHSIVKRDQIQFILGCAKMGHYRDGKNIKAILTQLKAQEQRLSESGVSRLLSQVKDLPPRKRNDYGEFYRHSNGKIAGKRAA